VCEGLRAEGPSYTETCRGFYKTLTTQKHSHSHAMAQRDPSVGLCESADGDGSVVRCKPRNLIILPELRCICCPWLNRPEIFVTQRTAMLAHDASVEGLLWRAACSYCRRRRRTMESRLCGSLFGADPRGSFRAVYFHTRAGTATRPTTSV